MEEKNFQELILNQLVSMSNQMGELKGEMRQGFKEVKGEIKELREDVDELKVEVKELREDVDELKEITGEHTKAINELRKDVDANTKAIEVMQTEVSDIFKVELEEARKRHQELWEAMGKNPPKKEYNKKIIKI